MADIDSLIAGGVQYPSQSLSQLNDPRKIMQLMQGAQELKAGQQQMQGQMALRQLMGDPKNMGSNGELTPDAMRQMSAIDPQGAMKIREMQLKNQELTAKTAGAQTDLAKKKLDLAGDMYGAGLTAYEDGLSKGLPKDQALMQAQKVYTEKREFGKPLFSESEFNMSSPTFDPNTARAHAVNYKQYQELQDKKASRDETHRHNTTTEDETKREHNLMENDRSIRRNAEKLDRPTEIEVRGEDGQAKKVFAQQVKSGPNAGQWVSADENRTPVKDVVGTAKESRDQQRSDRAKAGLLSDEALDLLIERKMAGDRITRADLGSGNAGTENLAALNNRLAKWAKEKGISGLDLVKIQGSLKADQASEAALTKMSDAAISFEETAKKNLAIAEGLMKKGLGPTGLPIFDRWAQAGRKATGDGDVAAFETALNTFSNEYAKIMSGATGAQGATVDAMRHSREMLNGAMSEEQLRQTIDVMKRDMENRKTSLLEQRKSISDRKGTIPSGSSGEDKDPLGIMK